MHAIKISTQYYKNLTTQTKPTKNRIKFEMT